MGRPGYMFDAVVTIEVSREGRTRSEAAQLLRSLVDVDDCVFVLGDGEHEGRIVYGKAKLSRVGVHVPQPV